MFNSLQKIIKSLELFIFYLLQASKTFTQDPFLLLVITFKDYHKNLPLQEIIYIKHLL